MKNFRWVPVASALFLSLCARSGAENPEPLSLLKEKNYPVQGFIGLTLGEYTGDGQDDYVVLPSFYFGLRQVDHWELWDTPVEFDLGRSAQLSLRNIEGTPWSVGVGLNYNAATVRERDPNFTDAAGYSFYSFGPYVYTRYQATREIGVELSERADYYNFHEGRPALRPDDYLETETRLLLDFDWRKMDPRPEVRDSGFYAGIYGFARQRPDDIQSGVSENASLHTFPSDTYGVGTLAEYLWQPWLSGNFGVVVEGEAVFNADPVRIGRTDDDRGRGHIFPHFLLNQDLWLGGSLELVVGETFVFDQ
ncbi:MAG: hypothetical protein JO317_07925, partial [Verrucomicrobiae bacterium]|nr:hypothetical protein [Verrucomicrobiae bacterium]